jgi:hypothetical protein
VINRGDHGKPNDHTGPPTQAALLISRSNDSHTETGARKKSQRTGVLGFEPKESPCQQSTYDATAPSTAPKNSELNSNDADVQSIVEKWPQLPPAIRAGIVAMVRAASNTE